MHPGGNNYVVIGGGIAGVCCAQELARLAPEIDPSINIILISNSGYVMESRSIFSVTEHLDEISVYEKKTDQFVFQNPNVKVLREHVLRIDSCQKRLYLADTKVLQYTKLCICTGVRPKLLLTNHENVLGLRDLTSVETLVEKLGSAKKVAVVGNGGIALELVHELADFDVDWIIKDNFIGSVFFDESAATFVAPLLKERAQAHEILKQFPSETSFASDFSSISGNSNANINSSDGNSSSDRRQRDTIAYQGYGVGPEWAVKSGMKTKSTGGTGNRNKRPRINDEELGTEIGKSGVVGSDDKRVSSTEGKDTDKHKRADITYTGKLEIHYNQEVSAITDDGGTTYHQVSGEQTIVPDGDNSDETDARALHPLSILTTAGKTIHCDFIISATGVTPNTMFLTQSEFVLNNNSDGSNSNSGGDNSHSYSSSSCRGGDSGARKTEGAAASPGSSRSDVQTTAEGYIVVDELFRTTAADVYAAGDCCSYQPSAAAASKYFFQMRLWTQARLMGLFTAQCMLHQQEEYGLDAQFELFTHLTRFFGYKVVMFGRYNAQLLEGIDAASALTKTLLIQPSNGLDTNICIDNDDSKSSTRSDVNGNNNEYDGKRDEGHQDAVGVLLTVDDERKLATPSVPLLKQLKMTTVTCQGSDTEVQNWLRITPGQEYIKLVVVKGKVAGALLIGETGLEEVIENLILNRLDVSQFGIELLNPEIDIDDYFD